MYTKINIQGRLWQILFIIGKQTERNNLTVHLLEKYGWSRDILIRLKGVTELLEDLK